MPPDARDLDSRLRLAQARASNAGRVRIALRDAERREFDARERARDLLPALEREVADVVRLESSQLTQLFLTVMGTKEERLAKERQESLAARLKYEEALFDADAAHLQAERLRGTLETLAGAEDEYERLLAHANALRLESPPDDAALLGSAAPRGALETETRELVEAIVAGDAALESLDALARMLSDTEANTPGIETLRALAREAQAQLNHFVEELADAGTRLHVELVGVSDLTTFTDAFLEGFMADWIVRSKVERASAAVAATSGTVSDTLSACRARLTELERE